MSRHVWFPTFRVPDHGEVEFDEARAEPIRNIGLHAIVLDRLITIARHTPVDDAIITGALRSLLDEAITINDTIWWRWLKHPSQSDYLYPPDYDDTAWARRATMAAVEHLDKRLPEDLRVCTQTIMAQSLCRELANDLCNVDECHVPGSGPYTAPYVFVGGQHNKVGNTTDIVVTVHVLHELIRQHTKVRCTVPGCQLPQQLWESIRAFLATADCATKPFRELSRFYMSRPYFLLAVIETAQFGAILDSETTGHLIRLVENEFRTAQSPFDASALALAARRLNICSSQSRAMVRQMIAPAIAHLEGLPAPVFYRHQRLAHAFGGRSLVGSFGIEALEINEIQPSSLEALLRTAQLD